MQATIVDFKKHTGKDGIEIIAQKKKIPSYLLFILSADVMSLSLCYSFQTRNTTHHQMVLPTQVSQITSCEGEHKKTFSNYKLKEIKARGQ